ncbi:MAG: hypothetical protein V4439_01350 [Patescibacteria group bacterium]
MKTTGYFIGLCDDFSNNSQLFYTQNNMENKFLRKAFWRTLLVLILAPTLFLGIYYRHQFDGTKVARIQNSFYDEKEKVWKCYLQLAEDSTNTFAPKTYIACYDGNDPDLLKYFSRQKSLAVKFDNFQEEMWVYIHHNGELFGTLNSVEIDGTYVAENNNKLSGLP